jgi:hypothetical protein
VQLLSRAAECILDHREDGTHASLTWVADACALFTQPSTRYGKPLRVGLELQALAIAIEWDGEIVWRESLDGRTFKEAGDRLVQALAQQGVDGAHFFDPLAYEMDPHPVAAGAPFALADHAEGLMALGAWYANAASALEHALGAHGARQPSPMRIWPHHFDMASIFFLDEGDPETARSVNTGFSPGDGSIPEPYFYVTPYPTPARLPNLPAPGAWHTEGFTAAVLRCAEVLSAPAPQDDVHGFLERALEASLESLAP